MGAEANFTGTGHRQRGTAEARWIPPHSSFPAWPPGSRIQHSCAKWSCIICAANAWHETFSQKAPPARLCWHLARAPGACFHKLSDGTGTCKAGKGWDKAQVASGALGKGIDKPDIPRSFTMLMSGTNANTWRAHLKFWRLSLVPSIQSFYLDLCVLWMSTRWRKNGGLLNYKMQKATFCK